MLAQLDSESLKANYRRFGSVDYEKVVKDIDKKRDNMLAMDLLEFFKPQFEKKFSEERARGAGS